jgi:hypothetical protein
MLALSGCISHPDYPQDWAARASTQNCADIAGAYRQIGDGETGASSPQMAPHLSWFLFTGGDLEAAAKADRVILAPGADGTFVARATKDDTVLATTQLALQCDKDGARINVYSGLTRGRGNPLAGIENSETRLILAEDRALIVNRRESDTGLVFMVLPMAVRGSHWDRFERIATAP